MYFENLADLLQMDGHGAYVWSAYAIVVLVVIALLVAPRRRAARQIRQLTGELRRQQGAPSTKEEN